LSTPSLRGKLYIRDPYGEGNHYAASSNPACFQVVFRLLTKKDDVGRRIEFCLTAIGDGNARAQIDLGEWGFPQPSGFGCGMPRHTNS
jgi:hypothetical protein